MCRGNQPASVAVLTVVKLLVCVGPVGLTVGPASVVGLGQVISALPACPRLIGWPAPVPFALGRVAPGFVARLRRQRGSQDATAVVGAVVFASNRLLLLIARVGTCCATACACVGRVGRRQKTDLNHDGKCRQYLFGYRWVLLAMYYLGGPTGYRHPAI